MNDELKLKPCPKCGAEAETEICRIPNNDGIFTGLFHVKCSECGNSYNLFHKDKETAIRVWNDFIDKNMIEEPKLKRCPVCNGKAEFDMWFRRDYKSVQYSVSCTNDDCGHRIFGDYKTKKEAAALWNKTTLEDYLWKAELPAKVTEDDE